MPIDIAHIDPRKPDGSNDVFENLIALCKNCHTRYDNGKIDRKPMRIYKEQPGLLHNRDGDFERRMSEMPVQNPTVRVVGLPGGFDLMLAWNS